MPWGIRLHPKNTQKKGEMKVWIRCARHVQVAHFTLHHRGGTLLLLSMWAKRVPRVGCLGVFICVRALPVPRHFWLGCACLDSGFGFTPLFLAGVVGVCVCLFACSPCTPPLLFWVCGVCVWVRVLAFTPPIQDGLLGYVCWCARFACTLPILAGVSGVCWSAVALHLPPCCGPLCVFCAFQVCGTRWPVFLGTCP